MIAFPAFASALLLVPDAGGTGQPLTRLENGEAGHRWPDFLPDARAVLFDAYGADFTRIAVHSLETGERRDLLSGDPIAGPTYPRYVPSGHLL